MPELAGMTGSLAASQPALAVRPPSAPALRAVVVNAAPASRERLVASPPADYYAAAQGKQGAALIGALHGIVRSGHLALGYAQARDGLFGLVADLDNDDRVDDIYTGRGVSGVTDRGSAFARNLNAEHTWPQSRGATGIAKSDLHQLMAADVATNAKRGHFPYGIVQREEWRVGEGANVSRLGVDASGRTVFEPRASVRGDIARALMYFYVRYEQDRPSGYTLENFRAELPTLLQWHAQDPVDDAERARNDAVFSLQRNRNPFIDEPTFADALRGIDLIDRRGQ